MYSKTVPLSHLSSEVHYEVVCVLDLLGMRSFKRLNDN